MVKKNNLNLKRKKQFIIKVDTVIISKSKILREILTLEA